MDELHHYLSSSDEDAHSNSDKEANDTGDDPNDANSTIESNATGDAALTAQIAGTRTTAPESNAASTTRAKHNQATPGRWAVHVSIPLRCCCRPTTTYEWMHEALCAAGWVGRWIPLATDTNTALHISLTRGGIAVQQANIEPLVQALTRRIQAARLVPFTVLSLDDAHADAWDILPGPRNDGMTQATCFVVWRVGNQPHIVAALTQLVECCNDAVRVYGQAPYYHPPVFHVSLARLEVDDAATIGARMSRWKRVLQDASRARVDDEESEASGTFVSTVQCTFGTTQRYSIPFAPPR